MPHAASVPSSIELMSKIFEAESENEFFSTMVEISQDLGFERFLVATRWFDENGIPILKISSTYPMGWQKLYAERQYAVVDPTVIHCQNNTDAIVWTEELFGKSGTLDFFEEAKSHGLGFGLSLPVHEARGIKSMISLVRDKPILNFMESAYVLAAGKVLASCAHVAHSALINRQMGFTPKRPVSHQESQCLRWVAMGKTSAEIGKIMSIAEPTVVFHITNVMEKLDVKNRAQAIAVGFRLGLLT